MSNSFQFLRKLALACVGLLALTPAASAAPTRLAPRSWITTDPLVYPTSDASHPVAGVKDPSVVFHDGNWHIFATTAGSNGWGMAYFNFASWDEAPEATPFYLDNNPNLAGYNAAPQVFYFRPQNKWYLIFQSAHPRFSTTDNIADPMSWSAPQDFFAGTPQSVVEGWLDYWIICDDTHAYLFFPDDHGRLYRSRTTLANFPSGFDEPVVIMHEADPADLFEGSCVYRIKGTNQFLLLVECIGKHRYYRAWVADRLDGAWTPLPGADSEATPFAGDANVRTSDGSLFWAEGVSHGELLREGSDETMTLDPENMRFLYQGFPRGANPPDYVLLPYHLALLESAPALPSLQTLLLFNEASGTTAADSTVNGRHGTLVNGPTRVTGKGGNAVDLDGTDDHVSLPTGVVSSLIDFTISTWVNLDAASPWSRIFDFGSGTMSHMFLTPANGATGTVRFAITTSGGGGEQQINGTSALSTGAWTHVAVTVAGNVGILYVNGVEVGRNEALTLTAMSLGATTQNWIGRSQYSDPYLNGRVDDFRIYGNALEASDVLALFNGTAGALAGPWTSQDIGSVGRPGSSGSPGLPGHSGSPGDDIYVTASGGDIWGGSDEFHYVSRTWTGDGTLIARVNGVAVTDAWAKAGLMFRESLNANARNALITVTPGSGISFQSRSSTGGETTFSNIGGLTAPYWLKLQRTGDVFIPYHSEDGITWTQTSAPVTLSLPTTCYVGFAATAHNNTLLTAAQFDHISLVAPPVPPAPGGLSATAGDAQVVLSWNAASGATSYTVKRATSSGGIYTTIAAGITATSYTDTGLTNGDTYYYVVSAVNSAGESAPSSEASATPLSAYQQWKLSNGLSLSLPDTATPDNDGVPILLKYASGLTPGTPSATGPTVLSTVNNTLTLKFTRLSPAPVNYLVESSTELSTWTTIATLPMASDTWTGPASVAETGTGATRATTVTDTQMIASGPERFLRLRVDVTAPSAGSAAVMPMPGFNLGNTLESTWGYAPPTKELIDSIADVGFKTLRVPCAWDWNSTNGTINAAYMTQVANVVDWALARGMYVIINDHWDNGWFEREPTGFNTYDSNLNSKLIDIWTQVANRFKWYDSDRLSFACANEPDPATQVQVTVLYQYYQNWINAMRANGGGNSIRWLIVQAPSPWNWDILLNYGLNMPADPAHKLMIETHTYDPGEFTVQGSDEDWRSMKYFWGSGYHVSQNLTNRNCTEQEESYLQAQFTKLKTNFADRGYPVLIGEWAGQPKPALSDLTGVYKDQNFRSVTYYNKFMDNTIRSFGFSGTYFSGQGDPFHPTTGAVQDWDKLNSILGIYAYPPISGL